MTMTTTIRNITPTTAPMMMGREPDDDEGDATVGPDDDRGNATVYSEHERKNPITTETDCYNNGNQSSRKGSVDTS